MNIVIPIIKDITILSITCGAMTGSALTFRYLRNDDTKIIVNEKEVELNVFRVFLAGAALGVTAPFWPIVVAASYFKN